MTKEEINILSKDRKQVLIKIILLEMLCQNREIVQNSKTNPPLFVGRKSIDAMNNCIWNSIHTNYLKDEALNSSKYFRNGVQIGDHQETDLKHKEIHKSIHQKTSPVRGYWTLVICISSYPLYQVERKDLKSQRDREDDIPRMSFAIAWRTCSQGSWMRFISLGRTSLITASLSIYVQTVVTCVETAALTSSSRSERRAKKMEINEGTPLGGINSKRVWRTFATDHRTLQLSSEESLRMMGRRRERMSSGVNNLR